MNTVELLSLDFDLQVDVAQVEGFVGNGSVRNVNVGDVEGPFARTRIDSFVAVVIDLELGIDGGEFGLVALELEDTVRVSVTYIQLIIRVETSVLVHQFHLDITRRLSAAMESTAHGDRLFAHRRDERRHQNKSEER